MCDTTPEVAISREHSRCILLRSFYLHSRCLYPLAEIRDSSDTLSRSRLTNYISRDFVTLSPKGSPPLSVRSRARRLSA